MSTPDYESLVRLLPTLHNLVDACCEMMITAEEASKIRSLGFSADAGRWKCPPLPPNLTRDNPLLEPLSVAWDLRSRLQEAPNSERSMAPQAACQQDRHAHLTWQQRSVEAVDLSIGHCKPERPVQLLGAGPDWERIEEVASKIEETLVRSGKPLTKRRLQQRLWRYPATVFNAALTRLSRQQRILLEVR
jgi:hypothetical protein